MTAEIITNWTTASGGGKVTVHHVQDAKIDAYRTAWGQFLTAIKGQLSQTVTASIAASGRSFDPATGLLTGEWTRPSLINVAMTSTNSEGPDSSQVLLRLRSTLISRGRFVKGRTFIPGLATNLYSLGNVATPTVDLFQTSINTFVTSSPGLVVWQRPTPEQSGAEAIVSSVSVWNEAAVLRRRRK